MIATSGDENKTKELVPQTSVDDQDSERAVLNQPKFRSNNEINLDQVCLSLTVDGAKSFISVSQFYN